MPVIPLYDPEANAFIYYLEPDIHPFHSDSISDITSEAETSESGQTIGSEDLPAYFVQHRGHLQPAGNVVRWFPADNTRRFIIRHFVESYIHQGNYAPVVKEILPLDPGRAYCVLELGTRDGTWVQEMATEFPHVYFRSVDVAPIIAHVQRSNVMFEVYDFTERLLVDDSSQDIVFLNVVLEIVKDYPALIREAHRVLRPGGLIHIRDFDLTLYDSETPSKPARRSHPVLCHVLDQTQSALAQMGVDPLTFERLPGWLIAEGQFENIQDRTKLFPAYPHDSDATCRHNVDRRIAPYLEHLAVSSLRDLISILGDAGMEVEEAKSLIEESISELRRPGNCALLKLPCIYAFKSGM